MIQDNQQCCQDCKFFERNIGVGPNLTLDTTRERGRCRRYPPTVFLIMGPRNQPGTLADYPGVQGPDIGCGEFVRK